jgi:hypothetical protein
MPLVVEQEMTFSGLTPPFFCKLSEMINYPPNLQEPQIAVQGTFGSGKSQFLNLVFMLKLAQGYKGIMFVDQHLEARNLCIYGYYDEEDAFHPFEITLWLPRGYVFYDIWKKLSDDRTNVKYRYYTSVDEIIIELDNSPFKCQALYYDCFDERGRVNLFNDLMERVGRLRNSREQGYNPVVWGAHELSEIMPMQPNQNTWKSVQKASNLFVDFRKQDICSIVAYQLKEEVFWRFSHKWNFICQKRPAFNEGLPAYAQGALTFKAGDVNISREGFWRRHHITPLEEIQDQYRIIPQIEKWSYPEMEAVGDKKEYYREKYRGSLIQRNKLIAFLNDEYELTPKAIGKKIDLSQDQVRKIIKKMEE